MAAGLLRRLTGRLAFPLNIMRLRNGYGTTVATDTLTSEQLDAYLNERLVKIVCYAARHIPFYKRVYAQANIDVTAFRGIEDMAKLPTISKADLLEHGKEMVRPGGHRLLRDVVTTGGSTGTIATIMSPRGFGSIEMGCIYGLWKRLGVRRGDKMVRLRGTLLKGGHSLFELRPPDRLFISTYHLRDENVDEIIAMIDDYGPKWFHVYPSAATLLATILQRTGKRLKTPIQGVLCGSENVFDWQVDLFREVFDCPTYSHYGHGELALLGGWCGGSRAFHFLPNYGYLELLDDAREPVTTPGVSGEMTGTGVLNRIMPLIRYRTADYGTWDAPGPCPACGRAHQRLATIDGRIQEYLELSDGTKFPATNINALHGQFFSYIYRFQFVQDRPGRARLLYVPARELTDAQRREIVDAFAFFQDLGLELSFEAVSEIPLTNRGKQRIVVRQEPERYESSQE